MRILAGRFRGLTLKSPEGLASRPTLSRVRQSLFDTLAPLLPGSSFLDLYAGAGSIGLEAFSRGSERVVFVESDPEVAGVLYYNVKRLDPAGAALSVLPDSAAVAVPRLLGRHARYDFIFLDPPYAGREISFWQGSPDLRRLLKPGGWVLLQHGQRDPAPDPWAGLRPARVSRYGRTTITFFARTETAEASVDD